MLTMTKLPARLADFARDCKAVAALEFALVATFLFTLMVGGVELSNRIAAYRGINQAAYSIAQIISEEPNPPGTANYQDLQMAHDSALLVFPQALQTADAQGTTWSKTASITISEAVITQTKPSCKSKCALQARIAWSWGDNKRPCVTPMTPGASDAGPFTTTTLPPDAFSVGAAVIADVSYTYTPVFLTNLFGPVTFAKTIVLQPRNVPPTSYIQYDAISGDPGATTVCNIASPSNGNGGNSGNGGNNGNGNGNINGSYDGKSHGNGNVNNDKNNNWNQGHNHNNGNWLNQFRN